MEAKDSDFRRLRKRKGHADERGQGSVGMCFSVHKRHEESHSQIRELTVGAMPLWQGFLFAATARLPTCSGYQAGHLQSAGPRCTPNRPPPGRANLALGRWPGAGTNAPAAAPNALTGATAAATRRGQPDHGGAAVTPHSAWRQPSGRVEQLA
jgi:hypothetical protein